MRRRSSSERKKLPWIILACAVLFGGLFALKDFDVPVEHVEKEIPYAKLPK